MSKNYTYDPSKAGTYGKDRMRFELGDTEVEEGADSSALCDEEYAAVIPEKIHTSRMWKKAKLACLESIFHRFAYEPDTKVGPVSFALSKRAELWKKMYDDLKAELSVASADPGLIGMLADHPAHGKPTPPYFYAGMHSTEETKGEDI